jgi:hypothetical protein
MEASGVHKTPNELKHTRSYIIDPETHRFTSLYSQTPRSSAVSMSTSVRHPLRVLELLSEPPTGSLGPHPALPAFGLARMLHRTVSRHAL